MVQTIHPFPARMAPELALQALEQLSPGALVVDPMTGSGTVLRQAIDRGCRAVGFDMDPLAVLMSRVWTTPVSDAAIASVYSAAQKIALGADPCQISIPWIDDDKETEEFISYWFGKPQADALRCWAGAINQLSSEIDEEGLKALDVIRIALSRIIVTKEQCASLARDTSHSRPHRVAITSDYCVHQGLDRSLKVVRKRLIDAPPAGGANVKIGDARALDMSSGTADAVLTSPPYLNAIDYMRGHRMSLIWLGYPLSKLRSVRSDSIGAERAPDKGTAAANEVREVLGDISSLPRRHHSMIDRYVIDVLSMAREIKRVLKPGGVATLVVGNSCLKGVFIRNSDVVARALELEGMSLLSHSTRSLPAQNRYLPTSEGSSLANRMREEIILRYAA